MEELKALQWKPCPFCGGTDIRWDRHPGAGRGMWHAGQDVFSMCCRDCGGTVPNRYSLELLNESWNRRSPSPSLHLKESE
jgi:Lar family restriction alleviation protein